MNELFAIQLKTEALTVNKFLRLDSIRLEYDNFKASYRQTFVLSDTANTEAPNGSITVDRSIGGFKDDGIDFNGVNITLDDFRKIGVMLAEKWRAIDDEARAKDAADAAANPVPAPFITPKVP